MRAHGAWLLAMALTACGGSTSGRGMGAGGRESEGAASAIGRDTRSPAGARSRDATGRDVRAGRSRVAPRGVPAAVAELYLRCEDAEACPAGIAIVVDANGARGADGRPNRCTGVLVGADRLLTASHCLAAGARRTGAACDSTWVGFAAVGPHPREWIGCAAVEHANDVRDDEVLRPDWAVLRLERSTTRPALDIDPAPPAAHAIVQVVSVTPHAIYRSHHAIGTRLCRVRTTTEATELFGADAARVGWLSDCPSYPGNSGAPILDRDGRVRGILHGGSAAWPDIGVTTPAPILE